MGGSRAVFCHLWLSHHRNPVGHKALRWLLRKLLRSKNSANFASVLQRVGDHVRCSPTTEGDRGRHGVREVLALVGFSPFPPKLPVAIVYDRGGSTRSYVVV